ncbi:metallophosphoesterase [Aeromicrobium fastidiosum]|uniref:Metallophosphoesterase n=1 Tax=Aeromicrobium fastidiosum TaxID=52699 RepID=A0A641AT63_9ACTN|nr:metallophosphoesterase [Aeromicrobium fastidiosum]KAA1380717.1 metallophosphoesterase [Aeromicrobium fastidiosum]MBP2390331.1 putative MPP superfamily phosphohydrolase [Aeromicrobium fastidiosum]
MRPLLWPVAAAAAGLAWSVAETRAFTLRRVTVPVLAPGSDPLRVLHLSDTHMTPGQHRKQRWLQSLAELQPDLVVNTGDNLAHLDAVPSVLSAYGDLLDVPGVFVFGSNDYFSPERKNPVRYLTGGTGVSSAGTFQRTADLPFEELRRALAGHGWVDLNNRQGELEVDGRRLSFDGVDDPHLEYDVLVDRPADATADLAIGVAHAPYLRVLDHWNRLGYPLILAGHTHGGQLRVPLLGALVTNCDLDRARARGLHTHRTDGHDPSWMHVSAGLGTSPYAQVRFACRPEATLLTLTGIDSSGSLS